MNKQLFVLVFILFGGFQNAVAASTGGDFGAGVILGGPTALTGKYWLDSQAAIDMGLSFSFQDYILVYGDYLFHFPKMFGNKNQFVTELIPYLGVGGVLVTTTSDRNENDRYLGKKSGTIGAGVRVPFGIEWMPAKVPIGVFIELVPGVSIIPATTAFVQGGIGIRYYF